MRKLLLMVAALIAIGALPAAATPIITLNETGVGAVMCNHVTGCTFALSFAPTAGQLLLVEPELGFVGDVITFKRTSASTGTATFASDNLNGLLEPGDTFAPPPPLAPFFTITEPLSGMLVYMPTSGQPGFAGVYGITSPPAVVAEPSSMLLLGAGLLGIVGILRRKSLL
jgi:hypothetical protein